MKKVEDDYKTYSHADLLIQLELVNRVEHPKKHNAILSELKSRTINVDREGTELALNSNDTKRTSFGSVIASLLLSIFMFSLVAFMFWEGKTISRYEGFDRYDDPFIFWLMVLLMVGISIFNVSAVLYSYLNGLKNSKLKHSSSVKLKGRVNK